MPRIPIIRRFGQWAVPTGMQTDAPPHLLPNDKAQGTLNMLGDLPNRARYRGPLTVYDGNAPLSAGKKPSTGMGRLGNVLIAGYAAEDGFYPWRVGYPNAATPDSGSADVATFNLTTRTWTKVTLPDTRYGFGSRWTRLGGFMYYLGLSSSDANVTVNGATRKRTHIIRWDGTQAAGGFLCYVNGPEGAQDIKTHNSRLFVLGGRDVAGGAAANVWEQNTLYWSAIDGPGTSTGERQIYSLIAGTGDVSGLWIDPVSGLVNKLRVGPEDSNDFGVGLAEVGRNLLILKRHSVWLLTGYSHSTYAIRNVTSEFGCTDANTICECNGGVYWMSERGLEWFDGTAIQNRSDGRRDAIQGQVSVNAVSAVPSAQLPALKIIPLPNNYLLVNDNSAFLYHIPTRSWTQFASPIVAQPLTGCMVYSDGQAHTASPASTWAPNGAVADISYVSMPQTVGNFYWNNLAIGLEDLRVDSSTGNIVARYLPNWYILFRWQDLDQPVAMAKLLRLYIDFNAKHSKLPNYNTDLNIPMWKYSVGSQDLQGNHAVIGAPDAQQGATINSGPQLRYGFDYFGEVSTFELLLSSPYVLNETVSDSSFTTKLEFYGAAFAYELATDPNR